MTVTRSPTLPVALSTLPEESIEELYEQAPCGYISMLPDGTFVRMNKTFLTWSGYCAEELVGVRRFQDLLPPGGKIYYETHYAPLLQMQGFVNEMAFDFICKNGGRLPILINAVEKRDAAGQPFLTRVTIFDASDRRKYERELLAARRKAEQAMNSKVELLAMLSHDIRGPLSAISGVAHLLERSGLSQEQQKWTRMLRASSDNMLALVTNLLDLGKIEAGAVKVDPQRFNIHDLRRDVMLAVTAPAEAKQLALHTVIGDGIPDELIGDVQKLKQILSNLLGNAVKFTAQGSVTLRISLVEKKSDSVSLSVEVTDTGIGIAPDRLNAIFEEYVQADGAIGARYGGSGLGLAICRKLLDLLGSKMTVKSVVGEGATFAFIVQLGIARV